jgi:hypothetical protein
MKEQFEHTLNIHKGTIAILSNRLAELEQPVAELEQPGGEEENPGNQRNPENPKGGRHLEKKGSSSKNKIDLPFLEIKG